VAFEFLGTLAFAAGVIRAILMRIAITADPEIPVPPKHYGGIERVVDLLVRGLVRKGHDVTLFAHPASSSVGRLIPFPGGSSSSPFDTLRNIITLTHSVFTGGFDVIHSFSRLNYLLPILPLRIPKVMTYQRAITRRSILLGSRLSNGTLHFTAISRHMMKPVEDVGTWHLVPNCASLERYKFRANVENDAPLMFLGRIDEIKGTHLAVEVALRTGLRLCIAGNVPNSQQHYFETRIKPFIDGHQIVYVGPVDDEQKNLLLGQARALLMPVLWDEPFGIVMIEAMACGTPVVGLDQGAVREVVEDGVSGFVRHDLDGMIGAVERISEIGRQMCRKRVELEFSDIALTEKYLSVYRNAIASCLKPVSS
jgi:glycosyltransferase involved in cell wall biosynthesis